MSGAGGVVLRWRGPGADPSCGGYGSGPMALAAIVGVPGAPASSDPIMIALAAALAALALRVATLEAIEVLDGGGTVAAPGTVDFSVAGNPLIALLCSSSFGGGGAAAPVASPGTPDFSQSGNPLVAALRSF